MIDFLLIVILWQQTLKWLPATIRLDFNCFQSTFCFFTFVYKYHKERFCYISDFICAAFLSNDQICPLFFEGFKRYVWQSLSPVSILKKKYFHNFLVFSLWKFRLTALYKYTYRKCKYIFHLFLTSAYYNKGF